MFQGLLFFILIIVAFFGFGAIGMAYGEKLQKRPYGGQNLDYAFFAIFGGVGVAIVLWIISLFSN